MIQDGYSICFNKWVLDTQIKNELPILLIISSLCAKTGECFANNSYFASLFNCTEVSVSQKINKLIKCGYLSVEYEKRGAEIKKRVLRLKNILTDDSNIFYPTIKNIFKDNNINNNNINNNLNISPCVRDEFIQRAKTLAEIISEFHKIVIPQNDVQMWALEISQLQKQNKIPLARMDKVLKMFRKYIDEDYIPAISNGKDFRMKFIQLEKQLEKIDSKYDWKVEW